MLGCYGHEGHAHDGVGAGSKDKDLAVVNQLAIRPGNVVFKGKSHAGGLANPVFLHELDALWPAQSFEASDQFVGIPGDAQVVHGDLAFFNDCTAAPALAVHNLFIGQDGLVHRVPVDGAGL